MLRAMRPAIFATCLVFGAAPLVTCRKTTEPPPPPQAQAPTTPLIFYPSILLDEPRRGLRLTITHMGGDADGFTVQRSDGSGAFSTIGALRPSLIEAGGNYVYDDWGLNVLQYCQYRVRAFKGSLASDWSDVYGGTAAGDQNKTLLAVVSSADAYVDQGLPTANFGTDNALLISAAGARERRAYMKFPVPQLPSYAVGVSSAVLRIFTLNDASIPYSVVTNVYEAMGPWTESGITWNNAPSRGFGALDFNHTLNNDGNPYSFDIASQVRDWARGSANNGIIFVSLMSNSTPIAAILSREHASAVRPTLQVTYVW